MTMPPHQAAVPPVQHEWIAGPGDAARIALSATLANARKPRFAVIAAICVVFYVARAAFFQLDVYVIFAVLLPLLLLAVIYGLTYRALRSSMAPGARWVSGFGEHELMVGGPLGRSVLPYSSLTGVRSGGAVVFLTVAPRGSLGFPAALFPPAAVEYVRGRIGRR